MGSRHFRKGIAKACHIDPEKLEFGGKVSAGKARTAGFRQMRCQGTRHFVARCHESVNAIFVKCAFADRIDIRIGRLAVVVNHDAAAFTDRQFATARQLISGSNSCRKNHHIRWQFCTIGEG